jgi:polysaccharide biosynthesis protein PslH
MKILLLTRSVPYPPDSGPKIKTYHLLRHLAAHHEVTLVSFARNPQEQQRSAQLQELCAAIHTVPLRRSSWGNLVALARSSLSGRPFIIERESRSAMRRLVEQLVSNAAAEGAPFDLVHTDQVQMAQYATGLPLRRLLDIHSVASSTFERLAPQKPFGTQLLYYREARLLRRYEAAICAEFEAITVVSEEDRQALLGLLEEPRELAVIPIGIDAEAMPALPRATDSHTVLSLTSMVLPSNLDGVLWFAREIYPLVCRAVPDAQLLVCGTFRDPEIAALDRYDSTIEVTGYIADPQAVIARAACMIVPQRSGSGLSVKILEALARGIPVVATTLGAEGIDLLPGQHLLIADTPSDFADAVSLLLHDPDLGMRLAEAGRQHVLERYDWRAVCPAIERVYACMLAQDTLPAASRPPRVEFSQEAQQARS